MTARFDLPRPGFTGHEKPVPKAWLAAQLSEAPMDFDALPTPAIGVPLFESTPASLEDDTAAAREALACGDIDDLFEATRSSMTPRRFLSNLLAAPRLTRLAIPPDPHEAVERFC